MKKWINENGTVYSTNEEDIIIAMFNRDTDSYMSLPFGVSEMIADEMNKL